MTNAYDFDVVVIGGGIGGFVSAVTANSLGKRVAIVEKRKVGGNCTNFTCIPSKALIRTSHVNRELTYLDDMGLSALSMSGVDTKNVMTRIRSVVQKAYEKDLPETFREIGIDVLSGAASFSDPHHIVIDGRSISSEKFIIAVGTRPLVPPIKGLRELDYLTNENLYELETLAVYDGISGKIKVTDTNDRDAWPYLKPWAAHFSYFTREKVWYKILRDVINR